MARMTKAQQAERAEAIADLFEILEPADELRTLVRHVSRSGMMRHIDVYKVDDGELLYLSGYVAAALGDRRADDGSIKVPGAGMDMGFHLVYNLARTLWPDGFTCIGREESYCPSNDHSNGDRDYSPHQHSDGGYALRQRWI